MSDQMNGNGGAAAGEQPVNGNPPPGGEPPFWNVLPENMRGATAEATLRNLIPSWQGYHRSHTERGPVLAKVEDVVIDVTDEKVKPFFDPKAPMMAAFAKASVDAGLTKTQANKLANTVMGQLVEGGQLAQPFDVKAEVTEIAKVLGYAQIDDAAKAGLARFEQEAMAWTSNMGKQLGLSERAQGDLDSLVLSPGGVELIRAMQNMGGTGFALGGAGAKDGALTLEKLHQMGADPRIDPMSHKYDRAARAEYDAAWSSYFSKK